MIDVTTPSGNPSRSRIAPCSMCASTNAAMSCRSASPIRAGSKPRPCIAAPIVTPSPSAIRSGSSAAIRPTIARAPQKEQANRLPSSSQVTSTSSGRFGRPAPRSSACTAAIAMWTPSAPSYFPPWRTVSTCEPVTTASPPSVPSARPHRFPTASKRTVRPASSIQRRSSAIASTQPSS